MGGSYSLALRERAIKFVEEEGGLQKDACRVLGIHSSTLTKWLGKYRKYGVFHPEQRKHYRSRKVNITILKQMVEDTPDATLEELARPFDVYPSTIDYHLRKLKITRKKNHAVHRAGREKKTNIPNRNQED